MKKTVWNILLHSLSTNSRPQYDVCPSQSEIYCKFKNNNSARVIHEYKNSQPVFLVHAVKPEFGTIAKVDLQKRCLHGRKQYYNESMKSVFIRLDTLKFGVHEAALCLLLFIAV
jgi:hypothetical protein